MILIRIYSKLLSNFSRDYNQNSLFPRFSSEFFLDSPHNPPGFSSQSFHNSNYSHIFARFFSKLSRILFRSIAKMPSEIRIFIKILRIFRGLSSESYQYFRQKSFNIVTRNCRASLTFYFECAKECDDRYEYNKTFQGAYQKPPSDCIKSVIRIHSGFSSASFRILIRISSGFLLKSI